MRQRNHRATRNWQPTTGSAGFTLIEMMIVVAIIGVLAAVVASRVWNQGDKAKVEAARAEIAGFEQALEMFKLDNGRYPSVAEGLEALVPPPPAGLPRYPEGGYRKYVPLDPWDNPYEYRTDTASIRIVSYGADGRPGGDGWAADIDNAAPPSRRG